MAVAQTGWPQKNLLSILNMVNFPAPLLSNSHMMSPKPKRFKDVKGLSEDVSKQSLADKDQKPQNQGTSSLVARGHISAARRRAEAVSFQNLLNLSHAPSVAGNFSNISQISSKWYEYDNHTLLTKLRKCCLFVFLPCPGQWL